MAENPLGVIRLVLTAALVLAQAAPTTPPAVPAAAPSPAPSLAPIVITRCIVTKPRPFSHRATGTTIAFVNGGPTLVHHVTFSVSYRSDDQTYERIVDDEGIFAPNTPVEHHYPLYSDIAYAGPTPLACRVVATG